MQKKAIITGIAGQDGSYLAEFLLQREYKVCGIVRESPKNDNLHNFFRINHILPRLVLYKGDITDSKIVTEIIKEVVPDEIYNLAAIVDPLVSFDTEFKILHNNISGIHNILGVIRNHTPKAKLFFASSSLIFGNPDVSPQNENTPKNPITPYGIAKTAGGSLVKMYREIYGIFACAGILYNHESPRRDLFFLPRKITSTAAKIKLGIEKELRLGDLDARRDWGFAGDYVEAMWLMLQSEKPSDYVIGTGVSHSVRDILDITFGALNLDWQNYVVIDEKLMRPQEKYGPIADISKIKDEIGWRPKMTFGELIKIMTEEDLHYLSKIYHRVLSYD